MLVSGTPSETFAPYKKWRAELVSLPIGTVLEWVKPYNSGTLNTSIKSGQRFKITECGGRSLLASDDLEASKVYTMVLCSNSGRTFKRTMLWSVENIANRLKLGTVTIIN